MTELANNIHISIQQQDFSLSDQVVWLENNNVEDGAVVTFVGRVRKQNEGSQVSSLTLEHYPGMTEKSLLKIIEKATQRWEIGRVSVIHRVGTLSLGAQIVFVGVTSKHRHDAYAANEFIMDFLKIEAPFWKKEQTEQGEKWLEAKSSDEAKALTW